MCIYSDQLSHVQVVINCRYSVAQMCTREEMLAHNIGTPYFDDFMSYKLPTLRIAKIEGIAYIILYICIPTAYKDLNQGRSE